MGFALTPGEAPLHFSRSKNVMHVGWRKYILCCTIIMYFNYKLIIMTFKER